MFIVLGHCGVPSDADVLKQELAQLLQDAKVTVWIPTLKGSDALQKDDIDAAALLLAQEVCEAIKSGHCGHLSFVGIGTGGLIVRAAIPWLGAHRNCLTTYMSVGTPHLGVWLPALTWTAYVRTWQLRYFLGRPLWLDQVTHSEGHRAHGSRLHRLCECEDALKYFQRLIFVGSSTDRILPMLSSVVFRPPNVASAQTDLPVVCEDLPRSKILMFAVPLLWLARLRAWLLLVGVLLAGILALVLPSPPGRLGHKVNHSKRFVRDIFQTLTRRTDHDIDLHLATCFLRSLDAERLMRIEVCGCRGHSFFGQYFGSDVLANADLIKHLVHCYGAFLGQSIEKKG